MSSLMGSNPIPSAILRRKFSQFIDVLCCPAPPVLVQCSILRVDDTGTRGGCNGASYAASATTRGWRVSGGLLQGGQPQSAREQMESPIGPGHLGLEAPGDDSLNDADLRGGRERGARHAPPTWRNAKHAAQWGPTLEAYAVPGIRHLRARRDCRRGRAAGVDADLYGEARDSPAGETADQGSHALGDCASGGRYGGGVSLSAWTKLNPKGGEMYG